MKKHDKARLIAEILDRLYPVPTVPLRHRDAFTLLVSTLLSAQSTDARVNRVTPALFRAAPTPARMARLPLARIEQFIRPCGLARTKARRIRALAGILVQQHGGAVPFGFEALESLPGVGHKTASVVMYFAFGVPALPVDTHIHRLAFRWGLSDGSRVARTEADLKRLFPPGQWGRRHLQMIHYGREYCPARGHRLDHCIICSRYGVRGRLNRRPGGVHAPPSR